MIDIFKPRGPLAPVNKFYFILGCLTAIVIIPGSLYVALWLCFIGGIVQVVEACKATPVSSLGMALGFVRIVLTSAAGWGCFFVSAFVCSFFFTRAYAARNKQKALHMDKLGKEFHCKF